MEPEFVRVYRQQYKNKIEVPVCCYTCDNFILASRRCEVYDDEVPREFSDKINNCEQWIEEIPF